MTSLLADRAEEIEEEYGFARANEFHAIATGKATPIAALVDQWIAERPMKPRQQADYRRAVAKLTAWLSVGRHPEAIEKVTRRVAGAYISEAFVKARVHPRTANKDISCVASMWRWAERKGIVEENVWSGQSLPKPKTTRADEPRPFTDQEVTTLFAGKVVSASDSRKPKHVLPSPLLRDFMAIAALSGMRVEEIARLACEDTLGGVFNITKAKSKAGIRQVPIHPDLVGIIGRRTRGRKLKETLWPELPEPRPGSPIEKSQKVVKEFVAYRRKIGVDDREEGARQSRITFHSLRRTFVTKAEQEGNQPHLIEALVGHKRAGMTLGLYSGGPLIEQLRTVVESVKLKPLT
jgi:integrase